MGIYGGFAGVYDQLMDDFDYEGWADYYLEAIARAGVSPKDVCDCACGTGSMSVALARRGLRVTGVDLSAEMLEVASAKARAAAQKIMFVRQDMCRLALPKPVDAIICACDGVNYLATLARVRAFFEAAHAALKPGGCLAFDISSRYKLANVIGSAFFGEERDDVAYLWSNSYDAENRIIKMDVTFFIRNADGLYERVSETHRQRAHEADEIAELLQDCGFRGIKIYGDRTFEAPGAREERIHFFANRI
jgi:SAM-dependent methyltransferase